MSRTLLAVALLSCSIASAADKPNIVFILADDLGWTDLGVQGSKYYETPNIDRLASEGMRFTNGYSCGPNCQPTRAALMSGQFAPRTGIYTVGSIGRFNWQSRPLKPVDNVTKLSTETVTIAEALKQSGYATGTFGKWHLGEDPEHHPSAQGFDEAITSAGQHFNFKTTPEVEYPEGTYLADFLTDQAVDFIKRHDDQPFFLYLPHYGVHSPYQAKEDFIAQFKNKPGIDGHDDPTYAAMIKSVDESVGRVVATLEKLNLADNTLVIFSSDNGGVGGYESIGLVGKNGVTTNAPLRGGKGTLYEGGIRVPYIFRWPGKVEAGKTSDHPINSVGLYPTLLELAEASKPDQPLDGQSYLNELEGQGTSKRQPLYWHFPGYLGAKNDQWRTTPCSVIRDGDYKLVEYFEEDRRELYNLADDIGEQHNLAKSQPERAAAMHQQLVAWREAIGAKLPTPNEPKAKSGGKGNNKAAGKKARRRAAAVNDE